MVELATVAVLALGLAAAGFAAYRLHMPPALGYLVAGLGFAAWVPDAIPTGLATVAEIGILVLLFLIGLELDLKKLTQALRATAPTLPFDIALPAMFAVALARSMGWSIVEAAALGVAVAVGSDIFGERLASQPGVSGPARQRAMGVLISQDLVAGGLIALLVILGSGTSVVGTPLLDAGRTVFLLLLLAGLAVLLVPRLLDEVARRHVPELLVLWSVGILTLWAYVGGLAGARELGALIAGVAAAEAGSRYVIRNALAGVRDIAAALFFFAAGAAVPIAAVTEVALPALAVATIVVVGNLVVHVPAALASGLRLKGSIQAAAAVVPIGEFNLILVAVATREGLAHPNLMPIVLGAMLILLPAGSILSALAGRGDAAFRRLPRRVREPLGTLANAVRRKPTLRHSGAAWRKHLRKLLVDVILLLALGAVSLWARPRFPAVPNGPEWTGPALWLGLTGAIALPLLYALYVAYRDLVWSLVGLQPGERAGAGKVRMRLVDAWVALTAVLVLAFIALWVPRAVPVLVGGALIATAIATVAWRRLNAFHKAVGAAIGRVLGDDAAGARFLDQVMEKYPWGVRFAAVSIPSGSPLIGHTLRTSRLGALTGATVAVIQRGRQETVNPSPDTELLPGDHLVLLGDANQLARAEALIVAHRDAVRLSAQSHAAQLMEITVKAPSKWVDQVLGDLRIREETGTLVVGRWKEGAEHPQPFRPELIVHAGDRLILLGTPLQLQRARVLAEGIPEAT